MSRRKPFVLKTWVKRSIVRLVEIYDWRKLWEPRFAHASTGHLHGALRSEWTHPEFLKLDAEAQTALIDIAIRELIEERRLAPAPEYPFYWMLPPILDRLAGV